MGMEWTVEGIMEKTRCYQWACVFFAAADLDVFSRLGEKSRRTGELADELGTDERGTRILLDALAVMGLLVKKDGVYSLVEGIGEVLTEKGAGSVLDAVRHQGNCHRRWVQLANVVRSGKAAERIASIRGADADRESFIGAMHNFSGAAVEGVIKNLGGMKFSHLLDIGGASGTWTMAFLNAVEGSRATLFDRPEVVEMAKERIAEAGLAERVEFAGGDYLSDDELGGGFDMAWLSAITHQHSRQQNRKLYAKVYKALTEEGAIVIRDVVMDEGRTEPAGGAMFAVNMLVATEGGDTFTFEEYRADLEGAGFGDVKLIYRDEFMDSVIRALK